MRLEDAGSFALARIFRWKPRLARAIVEKFQDACSVFALTERQLKEVMGPYSPYPSEIAATSLKKELSELERLNSCGYLWISFDDENFPVRLNECEDGPLGLFVRSLSDPSSVLRSEMISVVGTRDVSSYGKQWCEKAVAALSCTRQRPCIVSGLAFGVDITAHLAALREGLPTIAVLGTGIDRIYPSRHENFAREIMNSPGSAIISEYPPGTSVTPPNFLYRNRIIAGLSKATVLVESRLKGGGMVTARQAASYNRDVFAVPGRNDDVRSQGCNFLIYSNIATALIDPSEFVKSLSYDKEKTPGKTAKEIPMDEKDRILVKRIRECRGIGIEELASQTGIPYKETSSSVYRLEAEGLIDVDIMQRCTVND